jgi:hypothetical protein
VGFSHGPPVVFLLPMKTPQDGIRELGAAATRSGRLSCEPKKSLAVSDSETEQLRRFG